MVAETGEGLPEELGEPGARAGGAQVGHVVDGRDEDVARDESAHAGQDAAAAVPEQDGFAGPRQFAALHGPADEAVFRCIPAHPLEPSSSKASRRRMSTSWNSWMPASDAAMEVSRPRRSRIRHENVALYPSGARTPVSYPR